MIEPHSTPTSPMLRPLRLGDIAPDFQARTTFGDIRLSDYRGRWLVFFSHPADFTPVCTSEFVAIAKAADAFAARDCALLALSVDSLHAHFAWVHAIRQAFGITIGFPIVEDPSMVVGRSYGMIDEQSHDSAAMRATYFIDPDGVIRAMTCYPLNVGRSVDEMLRMVAALQRTAGEDVLAPEGWRPGDDLLAAPPQHQDTVLSGTGEHWFYQPKPEPK